MTGRSRYVIAAATAFDSDVLNSIACRSRTSSPVTSSGKISSRGTTASDGSSHDAIASTKVSPPRGPPDSSTVVMSRLPETGNVSVPVIEMTSAAVLLRR